jgi:16S rRNA (uracil1498-N3)-methyltransferase
MRTTSTREIVQPVTFFFGTRQQERFQLSPEDSHHAVRVLRRGPGDLLWCIDGSGTAFEVLLASADSRAAQGTIVREHPWFNEPASRIELVCGMTQPARMDWVVEKATELGVHAIYPVLGSQTPGPGRVRRWSRIARGADKQCCRGFVPQVYEPAALATQIDLLAPGGLRICAEVGGGSWPAYDGSPDRIVLAVGRDNGFSGEELSLLADSAFTPVDLGPRRLRAETAVVAVLALLSK